MKLTKVIIASSLAVISIAGASLPAQAATHYKRTKTVKVSKKAYYSTSKTGKTYRLIGSTKKMTFKSNHALKNYAKTTWTRSSKTYVTKHGKKVLYYYVTNSHKQVSGWVAASYLKAGKNYQATSATKIKSTSVYRKQAGKLAKLSGKNSALKLTTGASLKSHLTYTQSKQRNLYIHGKKTRYVYIKSADGKVKGWTKASYLKAGRDYQMTTPEKMTTTNYVMAKAGKVYTLNGTNQALTFINGQALTDQDNYTATESRIIYKKNKANLYYHVSNTDGSLTGWVYAPYLKTGKHDVTTAPTTKPETPVESVDSSVATSSSSSVAVASSSSSAKSSSSSSAAVSSSNSSIDVSTNDFKGVAKHALYTLNNEGYLYTDYQLQHIAKTTIKGYSDVTVYPDNIHQLSMVKYSIPVTVEGQNLYLAGAFQELDGDSLYLDGFYQSVGDTLYSGSVKPTDKSVNINKPFLNGTVWFYYHTGGCTSYTYSNGNWTIN